MNIVKKILKWIVPYGLVKRHENRELLIELKRQNDGIEQARLLYHADRNRLISTAVEIESRKDRNQINALDLDAIHSFLEQRGLSREHLAGGSIPNKSLQFIKDTVGVHFPSDDPLYALHVGNFVGVSLTYLSGVLIEKNKDSKIFGIDPNLTHREVVNPQSHVSAVLNACGIQRSVTLIAGYSMSKCVSNDGVVYGEYDPSQAYSEEWACECVLDNLSCLLHHKFDLVLIDGNHESNYVKREILLASKLLKTGGLVCLDDVDNNWKELQNVFLTIHEYGFEIVGTDGRIGFAKLSAIQ
jgi:hypothetical protein